MFIQSSVVVLSSIIYLRNINFEEEIVGFY